MFKLKNYKNLIINYCFNNKYFNFIKKNYFNSYNH